MGTTVPSYFYLLQYKFAKETSQHVCLLRTWMMHPMHAAKNTLLNRVLYLHTTGTDQPTLCWAEYRTEHNEKWPTTCHLVWMLLTQRRFSTMIQTAAYRLAEIQTNISSSNNMGFLAQVHCQVPASEHIYDILKSSYDHERGNYALQEYCIDQQIRWEHYCWKWRSIQC